MYEEQRELRLKRDVKRLVEEMQREEQNNSISPYTKREDEIGHMARILADELVEAIRRKELFLVYQPQVNRDGRSVDPLGASGIWIYLSSVDHTACQGKEGT